MEAALRRATMAAILAASTAGPRPAAAEGGGPRERTIAAELVRVDVGRRTLVLRPAGQPPREVDVTVDAETAVTASGRTLGLEELKTGERVVVSCVAEAGGPCRARRVRAGPAGHAVPPAVTRQVSPGAI